MVSPPSQRLWVEMMMMVVVVVMVLLPGSMEKCIFDEVQSQVRVVTAPPVHPDSPPSQTRPSQTRPSEPRPSETRPSEPRPSETRPRETRPSQTRPSEPRPSQTRPSETRPSEPRPSQTRPSQTRPSQTRPSKTRPSQTRPSETRPSQTRPSETRPSQTRHSETRSSKTRPSETRPSQTRPSQTRPSPTRPSKTRSSGHPGQRGASSPPLAPSWKRRRSLRERATPLPGSPQPIRIQTWSPRESRTLSQAEKERMQRAVGEAVGTMSSFLSVNRVSGHLLLSRDINNFCKFLWRNSTTANYNRCGRANENYRRESCLDVIIPDQHLAGCDVYPEPDSPTRIVLRPAGVGLPDTDFLLYLHVQRTDKCRAEPRVVAYAVHCQTDAHGRPLAGVVVICRDRLTGQTYSHQGTVQALVHELFHALGFSKDLFSTWRDCSSSSQVGVGCSRRGRVVHADGSGQMRIYTQSVVSALQSHVASTDPGLGGPLENLDVAPGGVSSHWESRVMQGSIMAAALAEPSVVRIDPVTLAALQDTGWYSVDLSRAQSLVFGHGEGAMFGSLATCQDNSSSFFCTGSGSGCHYLHLHKGECQTDPYLEGCHIYKPLRNGSECWKEENGRRPIGERWSGEIYDLNSRCFFSNLTREVCVEGPTVPTSPTEWPTLPTVLGIATAVCLLAAVLVAYRMTRSSRVRVHAVLEDPGGL
ncbi:ciliated left-right organizer metallopeptidase [Diretmus argenteus]